MSIIPVQDPMQNRSLDFAPRWTRTLFSIECMDKILLVRYYSRVCFNKPGQELTDQLRMCLADAIRAFFKVNNCVPQTVIFYRDGVGNGQLPAVTDYEIPQLRRAFAEFQDTYKPNITVIIVKKVRKSTLLTHTQIQFCRKRLQN